MTISKRSLEHAINDAIKQKMKSDLFDIISGILIDSNKGTRYYKFNFEIKYKSDSFKLVLEAEQDNLSIVPNIDGIYDIDELHFIITHIIKLNDNEFKKNIINFLNSIPDLTY